jgi:hypothetical protein
MIGLIAQDPSQQNTLRGAAQQAQATLKGGDLNAASDQIETLRKMIDGWAPNGATQTNANGNGAAQNGGSAAAQPDPAAAPAIAKARTAWLATRQKVEGDLDKLHSAFGSAFKGHEQEEQISKAFRARVETVLNTLDEELAHTLDAVNNARDVNERQQMVEQAKGLLQKYQQHVSTDPTIAALDSNPFVPLSVQRTMNTTIGALMSSIR